VHEKLTLEVASSWARLLEKVLRQQLGQS